MQRPVTQTAPPGRQGARAPGFGPRQVRALAFLEEPGGSERVPANLRADSWSLFQTVLSNVGVSHHGDFRQITFCAERQCTNQRKGLLLIGINLDI